MKLTSTFIVLACALFESATAVPARLTDAIHAPRHEDIDKRDWVSVGDDLIATSGDRSVEEYAVIPAQDAGNNLSLPVIRVESQVEARFQARLDTLLRESR